MSLTRAPFAALLFIERRQIELAEPLRIDEDVERVGGKHVTFRRPRVSYGKAALIANKKSAGRHKDLADVEELERLEEG